jgi:shikimate kinase
MARMAGLPFYDLDVFTSQEDRLNRNPRAIFKDLGPEGFQELELSAVRKLAIKKESFILALGGGTVENHQAMHLLDSMPGRLWVWLEGDLKLLFERILQGGIPPFLDPKQPWESFVDLAEKRRKMALEYHPLVFYVGRRDVTSCAQEMIKEVGLAR